MFVYVYVSSAVIIFSQKELFDLLAKSRDYNAKHGITGMLLYKDGNFMQLLEGTRAEVSALMLKINQDPRHCGITTLRESDETEQLFPDWSMGFKNLDTAEARATPGYTEFLNVPLTPKAFASDPTGCKRLLLIFKEILRG